MKKTSHQVSSWMLFLTCGALSLFACSSSDENTETGGTGAGGVGSNGPGDGDAAGDGDATGDGDAPGDGDGDDRTVSGGYSCTTEITCTTAPEGLVLPGEEFDRLEGNCLAQDYTWEAPGDCSHVNAFATCEEAEQTTFYVLVESGQSLATLEDRCERREGTWGLEGDNPPVAEVSVNDIELIEVSGTLAAELIPSSELNAYCEGADNQFGVAVTDNPSTGFTRYHYFACVDGEHYMNVNHFTQLLRDSYETLAEVPSAATNVAVIRIGERTFFVADDSCFNCTYNFAGSSGTVLSVTDFEAVDGEPYATVTDGAGQETQIALTPTVVPE